MDNFEKIIADRLDPFDQLIESSNELLPGVGRLRAIGDQGSKVVGGGVRGMDYFYLGREIKPDLGSESASDLIRVGDESKGRVGVGRGQGRVGVKVGQGERRIKKPLKS